MDTPQFCVFSLENNLYIHQIISSSDDQIKIYAWTFYFIMKTQWPCGTICIYPKIDLVNTQASPALF
jgi:hypothetical protein